MWKKVHTKTYENVTTQQIWATWVDVNNWARWHDDLDYCSMTGPFEVGNYFMLKPKTMSAVKIVLAHVDHGASFTDCTVFFGAKMYDTHAVRATKNGVEISNILVVTGPLKWLWIFLVANHVAKSVPEEVDALVKIAREQYA